MRSLSQCEGMSESKEVFLVLMLFCYYFIFLSFAYLPPFTVHFILLCNMLCSLSSTTLGFCLTISREPERPQSTYHNIPAQSVLRMEICAFLCLAGNGSCSLKSCRGNGRLRGTLGQEIKKRRPEESSLLDHRTENRQGHR